MKIVLIGAGSFVFGPSVLSQVIIENDLGAFDLGLWMSIKKLAQR